MHTRKQKELAEEAMVFRAAKGKDATCECGSLCDTTISEELVSRSRRHISNVRIGLITPFSSASLPTATQATRDESSPIYGDI